VNHPVEYLFNHGYVVLFLWVLVEQVGVPIPSGPILLAAGALVGSHRMNFGAALGFPVAACLIADSVWFCLGRRRGALILEFVSRLSCHPSADISEIHLLFSLYGPACIVLSKFVPGLGLIVPPLAGSLKVSPWKFALIDAGGALAWAGSHVLLGYLFRKDLESLALASAKVGFLLAASVVALMVLVAAIWNFRRPRIHRNSQFERVPFPGQRQEGYGRVAPEPVRMAGRARNLNQSIIAGPPSFLYFVAMGNENIVAIVDDDECVRDSLQGLMDAAGYEARAFASAEDFLRSELLREAVCLITDIRMPGMSGLELQQTLKAKACGIPIIFVTAHGNARMRQEAMRAGAVEFLAKPFDDEVLLASVRAALQT
jgi:membrane protein DedA with SNARE-associated domain/CheY-like chemotaxis protein